MRRVGRRALPELIEDVTKPNVQLWIFGRQIHTEFLHEGANLGVHPRRPLEVEASAGQFRDREGIGEHLPGDMALARLGWPDDRQEPPGSIRASNCAKASRTSPWLATGQWSGSGDSGQESSTAEDRTRG